MIAAFFSFAPRMVARALPSVWRLATPEEALRARLTGAVQALAEFTYELPEAHLVEAAELLETAAGRVETAGRVLGAVNAALPAGEYPLARLWQAATTLREHRGDGHVAALVAAGLDPVETLAWRCRVDQSPGVHLLARGWSEEQWAAAEERLVERGWLTADGKPTAHGRAAFRRSRTPPTGPPPARGGRSARSVRSGCASCSNRSPAAATRSSRRQSPIGLPALPG